MSWVNVFETEAWTFAASSPLFGLDLFIPVEADAPASIALYVDPTYGVEHHYISPVDSSQGTALGFTLGSGSAGTSELFQLCASPSGGVSERLFRARVFGAGLPSPSGEGWNDGLVAIATGIQSEFGGFNFPPDFISFDVSGGNVDSEFVEFTGRAGADWVVVSGLNEGMVSYTAYIELQVWVDDPPAVSYNCECDDEYPTRTLAQMREHLMIRLGWGAMVSTPLPGVAVTLDSFLRDAQEQIYRQYKVFRLERFFTWQLLTGVRFYDLPANEDVCTKKLDPRMITWVGISQGDNFWRKLVCGIKPEYYYGDISSWPTHYEIRQCIEVWPPPSSDDWKLRIKGYFGLLPLEADTDVNTIDYEAIQLFALANAKAHYGQPDAANYMGQYRDYIGAVTAGSHHTRRYVPNTEQSYPPPLPILTGYPGDP